MNMNEWLLLPPMFNGIFETYEFRLRHSDYFRMSIHLKILMLIARLIVG